MKTRRVHAKCTSKSKAKKQVRLLRAIDNKRFIKKLGKLTKEQITQLKTNLSIVLDL